MSELEQPPAGGISRRTVTKAMAWAVPVIAVAAPAPAFAVSGGVISFTGTGCKLPGNSNSTYKGYVFGLLVENTSNTDYVINILTATLDGNPLGSIIAVNLSKVNGQGVCPSQVNPFTIPKNTTPAQFVALVTQNAPSSSNGLLVITYTVNSGSVQTITATVPSVPPINGASCPTSTFTKNEKKCIANAINATFPAWAAGVAYNVGDTVTVGTGGSQEVWVCVQAGTSTTAPSGAVDSQFTDGTLIWQRFS